MTDEVIHQDGVRRELRRIVDECSLDFQLLNDDAYCVAVRQRILDRWYRFEWLGVTSRDELTRIAVRSSRGTSITVTTTGTPLERKRSK